MGEQKSSRCSFMIGSEVIEITPSKKTKDQQQENAGLFQLGFGHQLNQADSAWLAEILFTRRRHLSTPVFSASTHRRYSASKRRLLRRSLPTITELDSPIFNDEGYDNDDEGCFMTSTSGSNSEPVSPSLSASSSGSSSGSDDDDFVQKWNKLAAKSSQNRSKVQHQPIEVSLSAPCESSTATTSSYYELFGDENSADTRPASSSDEDPFADELSRRLEIEAAAKRKDTHQRFQMGVIGQVARFAL